MVSNGPTGLPPHDLLAEEAVLAALMMDADVCAEEGVFRTLEPSDFFREQNGWAYRIARELHERGETPTPISMAHDLDRGGFDWTPEFGWVEHLAGMLEHHFTAHGCSTLARIVAKASAYRRLIEIAQTMAQAAYRGDLEPSEVQEMVRRLLDGLRAPANVIDAAHRFRGGVSLEYVEVAP